jgi:hypothetical protein
MSACVNARMVCVRTFPRAPVLNPSAVMEISSGASTTETMSYSPSVQNTSFTVAPHFFAMALKASARARDSGQEKANAANCRSCLPRAHREQPCRRASEQREELATFHC